MNTQRVVIGGVAAGITIFVLDFIINGLLLGNRWREEMEALNPALVATSERPAAIAGFAVMDVLLGILLVWLYAAIRPRFGAGPKTAVLAGLYFWAFGAVMWMGFTMLGMFSWSIYVIGTLTWVVVAIAAAYVGGMLYKEEGGG